MTQPFRVVLDTNVIISALISPGTPRHVIDLCRRHDILLVTSDALLAELAGVLRRKFHWDGSHVRVLLDEIRSMALVVVPSQSVRRIAEDPADNMVLECAMEGIADFIVSGDTRHLQPLGSFEGIPILSPADFIVRVGEAA